MNINDLRKSHIPSVKILLPFPKKSSVLWMKNQVLITKVMIAGILLLVQVRNFAVPAVRSSVNTVMTMIVVGYASNMSPTVVLV
jgi:hypothetical protein